MTTARNNSRTPTPTPLRIPSLSASIAALMNLSPSEEDHFDAVLELVSDDPGLGMRLLSMANSALLSSQDSSSDLCRALMRVGPRRFVSIVVGGAIQDVFEATTPELEQILLHSRTVAALNEVLATELVQFELHPHVARTLGLLHNIGALVLAANAPERYDRVLRRHNLDSRAILSGEREELGVDHVEAGLRVADRWSLPKGFRAVIRDHHSARGESPGGDDPAVDVTRLSLRLQRVLACGRGDDVGRSVAIRSARHEAQQIGLQLEEHRIRHFLERALSGLAPDPRAPEALA